MNLILHIRICQDSFNFGQSISVSRAEYIDVDNFSEGPMIATINRAIDESERLFVFAQIDGEYSIGQLMKVFQKLMKYKDGCKVFHLGSHQKLNKLLKLLKSNEIELERIKIEAESYFI